MNPSHNDDSKPLPSLEKDVDALMAQELSAMSIQERERCYYDIHGISDAVDETPEFIDERLAKLDKELAQISEKVNFQLAESQNKEYTSCRRFRLKFLRAESFNPKQAAERLVRFFDEKWKLFGPGKLTKDIKLSDLDEFDRRCLESGIGQLLPRRDSGGRTILAWIIANGCDDRTDRQIGKSRIRVLYYLVMAAIEDEETQKKGMVVVMVKIGKHLKHNLTSGQLVSALSKALPNRWGGVHFCLDNYATAHTVSLALFLAGQRERAHFRKHVGSFQEVRYELMTFGIPMDIFPITHDDRYLLANHRYWVAQRLKLESGETTTKDELVIVPGPTDVLMGREWGAQLHPGNMRFRSTIAEHSETYEEARKRDKTNIAEQIVRDVKASGGRFLKFGGEVYGLVDDTIAREKVSSTFRGRRKAVLADEKRKEAEVSTETRSLEEASFECDASMGNDFVEIKRPRWGC